jgi:signal transduction histidine kinase
MDVASLDRILPAACLTSEVAQKLDGLRHLVDATAGSVRRISHQLRPSVLDDLGLMAALEWLAQDFEGRTGIPTVFVDDASPVAVARDQASALFRIAQEALTNVARHAAATRAEVWLYRERDELHLEVRDDGRGLTTGDLARPDSNGLVGMRERARLIGGGLYLATPAEGGTVVGVTLPVSSSQTGA